nr:BLOC-1-related complex subunit 7 isoform X1 [Pelodiscus sinensis]|eukprot:XP_014427883.1 BLOC-1-related complex subunit 7 isoform X1 [Pelodiscus sinensis]
MLGAQLQSPQLISLAGLLGHAARNMVMQEDAILHSEDSLRKMAIITTHLQYQQEAIQKKANRSGDGEAVPNTLHFMVPAFLRQVYFAHPKSMTSIFTCTCTF